MDKMLLSVDVPNAISVGVILGIFLVTYVVVVTYAGKWWMGRQSADNSGSSF